MTEDAPSGQQRPEAPAAERPEAPAAERSKAPAAERPRAIERRARGPGWIWAVPIAALAIVGYLAFEQLAQRGPEVVVTFPVGGDLRAGNTRVEYKGMQVGEVESVKVQKDLLHVAVRLRLDADMEGHLGPGTRYWVAGRQVRLSDPSSIKSILSGPTIGVDPKRGATVSQVTGLAQAPVEAEPPAGTQFRLTTARIGNISRGSEVMYRDLQVGTVLRTKLRGDGRIFDIDARINAPFDRLVHQGSRFWKAGAVQLSMGDGGPSLRVASLPAVFEGAIGFETPDGPVAGPVAKPDAQFDLFDGRGAADHAPDARAVEYSVVFDAPQEQLDAGAPVQLAGARIGTVTLARLEYDPAAGRLRERVRLAIEPDSIALPAGQGWAADPRPQMDDFLRRLVAQGWRARVGSTIPVVGGKTIELAMAPGAAPATLLAGNPPQIPTAPGGSGVQSIMSGVDQMVAKLDAMPIDSIAADIHRTTQHLATLSSSPEVAASLRHLDRTLANVEQVSARVRLQAGPMLAELHGVTAEAQRTLARVQGLVSGGALGASGAPGTAGLPSTLYELGRAARSLRELTDYLDRHPEALLVGKSR